MLSRIFNNIFSSRAFYIIFSLLASIALWMYVEYNVNEEQPHLVSNIPVVFRNSEVLEDRELLISSWNPQSVNLTFSVPRALMTKLQNSTVSVEVDLGGITSTGVTYLPYSVIYPAGVNGNSIKVTRSVNNIALNIDKLRTVSVDVKANYTGGTASGDLIAGTVEFSPQTITVYGPDEVVSQISEARVLIHRESLSSTVTDDFEFVLLDENKEEFSEELLSLIRLNHEMIRVTIPIKQIKDIPLEVSLIYGAGATEQNSSYEIDPLYVTVMGDPELLRELNSINLGAVNTLTRKNLTFNANPRAIIVPEKIENVSGEI